MNYSKVMSGTLIAFTIYMSVKNGLSLLRDGVGFNEMVAALHVNGAVMNALIGITLLSALLLLLPQTMFLGCLFQIACFICVGALQLRTGNVKGALVEMPFIAIVAVIAYLGHPFAR